MSPNPSLSKPAQDLGILELINSDVLIQVHPYMRWKRNSEGILQGQMFSSV